MIYPKNSLVENPPKTLAEVFGFSRNFVPPNVGGTERVTGNREKKCLMCGRIQDRGFIDPKRRLIGANTNDFYVYGAPGSDFLCDWCLYIYKHYMKKMQKSLDRVYGDMGDIVLYEDRFEPGDFKSSSTDNDLYRLLENPPKEAFALILKRTKGNLFVDGGHRFLPTVDSELFVVNYGERAFFVERKKVFEALFVFDEIADALGRRKTKFSEDVFFARDDSGAYNHRLSRRLRSDPFFIRLYSDFMGTFDKGTRFVAKMVKRTYDKKKKEKR